MTTLQELREWVRLSTKPYRKGDVVKVDGGTVSVDAFPERQPLARVVDCGFITVGFTEAAVAHKPQWLREALADNVLGEFTEMTAETWAQGPSYVQIGAWIGDQTDAFLLMALGELHGIWKVITPAMFGFAEDSQEYQQLIGSGYILVTPTKESVTVGVQRIEAEQ